MARLRKVIVRVVLGFSLQFLCETFPIVRIERDIKKYIGLYITYTLLLLDFNDS